MPPEGLSGVRRRPVQERSRQRVERMLDACAEVLDEVGYDALTTREVARRAAVPIGTLYQFFADRQALCRSLAERNLDLFVERLQRRLAAARVTRWADTAPIVVAEFVAMKRTVPGFAVVDFGDSRAGRRLLLDAGEVRPNNELVSDRLLALGVDTLGLAGAPWSAQVLLVAVEATDAVLRLAFRNGLPGDSALIEEATRLLESYLAARLDRPYHP
ncbi:MAG TPA: TetR/AcrR family transcriptional regulator [Kineosporiaceae bacterium]